MKLVLSAVAGVSATFALSVNSATALAGPTQQTPQLQTVGLSTPAASRTSPPDPRARTAPHPSYSSTGSRGIPTNELSLVVRRYCVSCHSPSQRKGNLSLQTFNVDSAFDNLTVSEKIIRKLRAEMMPPPGSRKPGGDTLVALVETLEQVIDRSTRPNPGTRPFQRLNRAEYERAVRDLLGVEINAGDYLPLDTKSANFDNIADAQALSTTMVDAYLNAAGAVSRIAIGDRKAAPMLKMYVTSPFISQHPWDHAEGAPYGTRGGIVAMHTFPADGVYQFRMDVEGGIGTRLEDIDVSVDGQRVALLHYERGINPTNAFADKPLGVDIFTTEPIAIKAGQKRLSVAFVRRNEGPYEDLIRPHDWSKASNGTASAGTTEPPAIMDVAVIGPKMTTGISETPSRRIVFSCRPAAAAQERPCAERIIDRLGTKAYRRPLTAHDRESLLNFYEKGKAGGGFEEGIRLALQAMLASPYFIFRIEPAPPNLKADQDYQISDVDLASRLSFFLWGSIPDDRLLRLASQNRLSQKANLEREVRRMLADPKAEALATRFAGQWLRLQDLDKVRPDAFYFPDYTQQLADDMRRETELFFYDFVRADRSVLDLFTADFTFVNERLARHYGIPKVSGPEFRRVEYPDATRRGLLGQGSILVQTSLANRTSPVLRGKWVMEVLLGMPPPPPPPGVPDLEETKDAKDGRPLTTRERMELHRANPTCNACHQYMDPLGLALDNFDVTGKWRYRENSMPLDTRGRMYDGTDITSPADLTTALIRRPIPLVRAFTENLMAYALGRRVEDFDQPTVRAIVRTAESSNFKLSSFVLGVVNSPAFRSKRADPVVSAVDKEQR